MTAGPAIRTSGLSKDYGRGNGLFDLDLEVRTGEVFGFLGPNGAGKSTTMRLLLDLIKPTSGSATVLGLDSAGQSLEARRRVGFLPGDFELYPKLTGAAMLDYLAALRGGVDRRVRDRLAERFGAQLDRPVRELSTGNRQKLGLIQAFMHEPELLILDEPIAGLDPLVQQSFHALLAEVAAEGRTVFLSSHTLSEVERVADRVAILRRGRLVVVDSLENLRAVAVQRLEIEFAGSVPSAEAIRALPGVREASVQNAHLIVALQGSADPLVKAIAAHEVRWIRSHDDNLEEIFLHYYRDDGGEGA
ncbi:MAG: beta-exotoxin transport system ATP-binding protein [Solirubrobacteraceae bacterium]|jgi:ABC-2 type transport system ATP-binding protein|nr:beta-exotoxin transport system ATP-binding protein [Solirubrobacteraceae bacterium]